MRNSGRIGFSFLTAASQWFYAAANVVMTRNSAARIVAGAFSANDDGSTPLQSYRSSTAALGFITNGQVQAAGLLVTATNSANPGILMAESANDFTCAGIASLTQSGGSLANAGIYVKNNKLVIGFMCGANGQIRYLSISLDGFNCTWVATTTVP